MAVTLITADDVATQISQKAVRLRQQSDGEFQRKNLRFGGLSVRVHLEADGVSSGEGFSCWARHFPAGILSYFKEK